MPVSSLKKIIKSDFFKPITEISKSQNCLGKIVIKIGSFSDRYLSFDDSFDVKELKKINNPKLWKLIAKIVSFIVTDFILPLFALCAKALYRQHFFQETKKNSTDLILIENEDVPLKISCFPSEILSKVFSESAKSIRDLYFTFKSPMISFKPACPENQILRRKLQIALAKGLTEQKISIDKDSGFKNLEELELFIEDYRPFIKRLDLSSNENLVDENIKALISAATVLHELDISYRDVDGTCLEESRFCHLKKLYLIQCDHISEILR